MKKKLTILHTTAATITTIPGLIESMYRDCFDIVNVLDDSLLNEIKAKGNISKAVIERFLQYVVTAKNHGSDAILLACSSIGKAGDVARKVVDIPLFKIDEPMADKAVESTGNILVLGTVQSTLVPTSSLIKSKMKTSSQTVECMLIPGAFELFAEHRKQHDQKIADVILDQYDHYDVIVLAQASMANAANKVDDCKGKLLTSLPLGLHQLKRMLEQ